MNANKYRPSSNNHPKGDTLRKYLVAGAATLLLLVGCTSGDDEETPASGSDTNGADEASGPAPGVTEDTIKVGVTFVDLAAIRELTDIDHGDYEAAYRAMFDDINANGGINGRQIEPVFAPVNPIGDAPAEEACVKLTQDEEVFAVLGFFQSDSVLCYVEANETAVVGGSMTEDRLARANAPWFTTEQGSDQEADVIRRFAEEGDLDGALAVVANTTEQAGMKAAEELLAELDIEPVATAVIDAPPDDVTAQNAAVGVIAERFRSAGAEKVLVLGSAGITWANGLEPTNYRPQSLFAGGTNSIGAYTEDDSGRDLSVLEDAVAGAAQPVFEEAADCLAIQEAAGLTIVDPDELAEGEPEQFVSSHSACRNVTLFRTIAEAAGEQLDYRTFRAAGEELGEVEIPGYTEPFSYGPPPSADGDAPISLLDWDSDEEEFVRRDG